MKKLSTLMALLLFSLLGMANSILTFDLDNEERRLFEFDLNESELTIQLEGLTSAQTYGIVIGNRQDASCNNLVTAHADAILIASNQLMGGFDAQGATQSLTITQAEICQQQLYLSIYLKHKTETPGILTENSPIGTNIIDVNDEIVHQQLFNLSPDFTISNAYIDGSPVGFGEFYNGSSSVSMDQGLMLATGDVWVVMGPNTETDATLAPNQGGHFDADLSNMIGQPSFDATALHFDVTANSDMLEFEYVFASEEYCDWVGSQFDDAFGVFISGPGISGPFSDNAELISNIDNTGLPISINNVNYFSFPEFYISNVPPWQQQYSGGCVDNEIWDTPYAPDDIQFDGFTVPMLATAYTIPGETYHVKIVIADMGDPIYDAGVFFRASPSLPPMVTYEVAYKMANNSAYVIRDCAESVGSFEFSRSALGFGTIDTLEINYTGSGVDELDMDLMPTSIIFDENEMTKDVSLHFVENNTETGSAVISILLQNSGIVYENIVINELVSDIGIVAPSCEGVEDASIELSTLVGTGPYSYALNGINYTNDEINGLPAGAYDLVTQDMIGCTVTQTFEIEAPTAIVLDDSEVVQLTCESTSDASVYLAASGGTGNLTYTWLNGMEGPEINNLSAGSYVAQVVDDNGCVYIDEFVIAEVQNPTIAEQLLNPVACNGEATGHISIDVIGTNAPFEYAWSDGVMATTERSELTAGTYQVEIIDDNGCATVAEFVVEEPEALAMVEAGFDQNICYPLGAGTFTFEASGGVAPYVFYENGAITELTIDNMGSGILTIELVDANGCILENELEQYEALEFEVTLEASAPGFCEDNNVTLTANMTNYDAFVWNDDIITFGNQYTIANAGTVNVVGVNLDGCEGSTSIDILEYETPTTAIPTGAIAAFLNEQEIYEVVNSLENSTIEWIVEGGTILSNPTPYSVEVLWNTVGSQTITALEISDNGCEAKPESLDVQVDMLDNVNEISQNKGIQLYPNPFDDQTQLILDMPTLSAVQVDLYNVNGQLLQTYQTTSQSSLAIQRDGLPSGTYVLVVSGESFRFHERLILR